ncbi:hypothetical protein ABIC12_003872 [Pantoea agglomerans]|jgi:hypothetical protein
MKVMYANLVLEENTCTMMLVRHFRVVVVSINSGYYIFIRLFTHSCPSVKHFYPMFYARIFQSSVYWTFPST